MRDRAWTWLGVELKKPVGWRWSSAEQEANYREGRMVKVHSWEEMVEALAAVEAALKGDER